MGEVKTCRDCEVEKPISEFHKKLKYTLPMCKVCRSKQRKISGKDLQYSREYYQDNKEKVLAATKKWAENNTDRVRAAERERYHRGEKKYESILQWRANNPESYKEICRRYQQNHPDVVRLNRALTKARRKNRVPPWLSPEQKAEISAIYESARILSETTGSTYEVDHIVPLGGTAVSGLHVPWNLQVILAKTNRIKGNQFDGWGNE